MNIISAAKSCALLLPVLGTMGCSSVHSKAVRNLIGTEGAKLEIANQTATDFISATKARTGDMKHAVDDLNDAIKQQNTSEMVHALIFSSNQNISSKSNVDAHAVTYLLGKLYLTEQAGLQQEVNAQFQADITALQQQAVRIQQSWASLQSLHQKVKDFANKSALASVDADFLAALAGEIPGASSDLETVLK